MSSIHVKKIVRNIILILLVYQIYLITPAAAIGEASMSLYAYVPSGGTDTATYIVVTATLDDTVVDIIDLDITLGDPTNISSTYPEKNGFDDDLSEYDVHLDMGQSRVIKVSYDGDLPDDDGAYFHVLASKPVTVYTGTALGYNQADFVPSNNGTMIGKRFFVYLPDSIYKLNGKVKNRGHYDLAIFSYEDNTSVSVYRISNKSTLVEMNEISKLNATTSINFSSKKHINSITLCPITPNNSCPPILYIRKTDKKIKSGQTYLVTADKNISVASVGVLNDIMLGKTARNGAYFVPGISNNPYRFGTGLGHTFYMQLSGEDAECREYRNEIYLINYNLTDPANVTIEEFDDSSCKWIKIPGEDNNTLNPNGIFTVSNSSIYFIDDEVQRFNHQGLIRVTSNDSSGNPMDISIFAGVYFGNYSSPSDPYDIATFASGNTGYGGSKEAILYIPPPQTQTLFGSDNYTHAYIYVYHNNTNITIQTWKNNKWGTVSDGKFLNISKSQIIDYKINSSQWTTGGDFKSHKLRVLSTKRTTVQISNWKDSWASYVPGGTPPEFTVRILNYGRYLTINSVPTPVVSYSFEVDNEMIGNIGSNMINLSVTSKIPDDIDQTKISWSVISNKGTFDYDLSPMISNSTHVWKNATKDIEVFYTYDSSGTTLTFNRSGILKGEVLTFIVCAPLKTTVPGIMVINVSAEAENPLLGLLSSTPKPPTIILSEIIQGDITLY